MLETRPPRPSRSVLHSACKLSRAEEAPVPSRTIGSIAGWTRPNETEASWRNVVVLRPLLCILPRNKIWNHQKQCPRRQGTRKRTHAPILFRTNTNSFPSLSRLWTSPSTRQLRHASGSRANVVSSYLLFGSLSGRYGAGRSVGLVDRGCHRRVRVRACRWLHDIREISIRHRMA